MITTRWTCIAHRYTQLLLRDLSVWPPDSYGNTRSLKLIYGYTKYKSTRGCNLKLHSIAHNDFKNDYRTHESISILNLVRRSIRGEVIEPFSSLASNSLARGSGLVQFLAINTDTAASSSAFTQAAAIRRELNGSGANTSDALIHRVPVTRNWRVLGERQVGLGVLNFLGLVGVFVDDGLRIMLENMNICLFSKLSLPSFERHPSWRGACHHGI